MPTEFRSLATLLNGERARHGAADVTLAATPAPLDVLVAASEALTKFEWGRNGQGVCSWCGWARGTYDSDAHGFDCPLATVRAALATPAPLDRFEHVPSGEPSDVNGLRHCLVCDETWPCEPRQRRDDHDLRHLHDDAESGSASGDPMDATYPGEGGPDDWG